MRIAMQTGRETYSVGRHFSHWAVIAGSVAMIAACGSDDDDDATVGTGGTGVSSTGGSTTGGKSNATGGRSTGGRDAGTDDETGGSAGTGGSATGGTGTAGTGGASGGVEVFAGAGPGGAAGAGGIGEGGVGGVGAEGGVGARGGAAPLAGAGAGGVLQGGASGGGGAPAVARGGAGGVAGANGGAAPVGEAGQGGTPDIPTTPLTIYVACADTTGSIQHYALDRAAWVATPVGTYNTGVSNSWATLNADQDRMYLSSRTEGRITTLSRDTSTGALDVMDAVEVPTEPPSAGGAGGAGPTGNPATQTLTLDDSGEYLLAANDSANYVYDLANDGTVGSLVESANDGISSHQVVFVPGSNRGSALVPYLGSDLIATYRFDDADGSLTMARTEEVDTDGTDATTGPRHLVFHPTEDTWVYVVNEVAGTIDLFSYDDTTGNLTPESTVSSVPTDYTGTDKLASEIAIAPSGEFVYVSNRYSTAAGFTTAGSLGVFAVDPDDGSLTPVEFESSRGALPRHFMLSSDGTVLVVGNQNSNNIAVFSVNTRTGALTHRFSRDVCGTPFFVQVLDD